MGSGISQSYVREHLEWELYTLLVPFILRAGGKFVGFSLLAALANWLCGGDVKSAMAGTAPFRWQTQSTEEVVEDLLLSKAAWEKLKQQERGEMWLQARKEAGLPSADMKELWREFKEMYAARLAKRRQGGGAGDESSGAQSLEEALVEERPEERLLETTWLRSDPNFSDYHVRWEEGRPDLLGLRGFHDVSRRLNIKTCRLAVLVATCRIVFWHLLQAAAFFVILWAYIPLMSNLETALSLILAAREALYMLFVLGCAIHCPAVFLYSFSADPGPGWRLLYVICPEKFLISALSNTLQWGHKGWNFVYAVIVCDCFAILALYLFVARGQIFGPLLLSFSISALSGISCLIFYSFMLLAKLLERLGVQNRVNPCRGCRVWFGVGAHW